MARRDYDGLCDMNTEPVLFYSHRPAEYACFSNFYPSPMRDDKTAIEFCCTEQWLMYHKAMLFQDNAIARLILQETQP